MSKLKIKPHGSCKWDAVSLGEVMIRLDPMEGRVRTSREFRACEGGGEYNVTRGLRKCFGLNTTTVTAIVDNEVGRLLEDLMLQGGVDISHVRWFPYDGIGRESRVGLNFTERGFGLRGALGTPDRGHSAASQLKKGDINWKKIFKEEGARWFHTGGIFAGLSETTPEVIREAIACARTNGTIVSYDLNYRASLWKSSGGMEKAIKVNRAIVPLVDVLFDFTSALGYKVEGLEEDSSQINPENFKKVISHVVKDFPNLKVITNTMRQVKSANINDWSAIMYHDKNYYLSQEYKNLEILDRIGGGDSFASGVIYALLTDKPAEQVVNYGVAHGALAMTTPGDTSMATLKEVEKVIQNKDARVER